MKKLLKSLLVLTLVFSLVACSNTSNNDTDGGDKGDVNGTECAVRIGLVTDTGGVDDKSFNQSGWEGLLAYATENEFSTENGKCIGYLQSESVADYVPNLSTMAEEGYDLVIAVGYLFEQAMKEVTPSYPDTKFLFIDSVLDEQNVLSAIFSAEHGSYLVGIAAGLKSIENGSNAVGFVGGMEGALIGAFQAGFEQGVLEANPNATIYVDYADSFGDAAKGQSLAVKQYDAGATVIFQAAGGSGNGVIKEAKERGDVWVIGVDKDQYADGETENGNVMLTSMVKRVDTATKTAAQQILDGTFEAGLLTFNLTNNGVSAEVSEGRNLSKEVIDTINGYAAKISDGSIEVSATPTIKNGGTNK